MKTTTFSNIVLSDEETLHMLKGFCYEALRFLKVFSACYPHFIVGAAVVPGGKVNPLVIDYNHSRKRNWILTIQKLWISGKNFVRIFISKVQKVS